MDSGGLASRYPPSAPRRDSTKPPCLRLARISSRNFCGIFCLCAMPAIFTGWRVEACSVRSKTACSAYSPLTDMYIVWEVAISCFQLEIMRNTGDSQGREGRYWGQPRSAEEQLHGYPTN